MENRDLFVIQVYDENQDMWLDINLGNDFYHLLNAYKLAMEDEPNRRFRFMKILQFDFT